MDRVDGVRRIPVAKAAMLSMLEQGARMRIITLERQLREERGNRIKERDLRIKSQQECAGHKSAIRRLQAIIAQYRATELKRKATAIDVEFTEQPAP